MVEARSGSPLMFFSGSDIDECRVAIIGKESTWSRSDDRRQIVVEVAMVVEVAIVMVSLHDRDLMIAGRWWS